MKSRAKREELDDIVFQWDHKAPSFADLAESDGAGPEGQRSLDEYLDFLEEIRPFLSCPFQGFGSSPHPNSLMITG